MSIEDRNNNIKKILGIIPHEEIIKEEQEKN
jgi:hypothetical protein